MGLAAVNKLSPPERFASWGAWGVAVIAALTAIALLVGTSERTYSGTLRAICARFTEHSGFQWEVYQIAPDLTPDVLSPLNFSTANFYNPPIDTVWRVYSLYTHPSAFSDARWFGSPLSRSYELRDTWLLQLPTQLTQPPRSFRLDGVNADGPC